MQPQYQKFTYDQRKFKDLLLYFAQRGLNEGMTLGSTKLNKLLFFTDFRAYQRRGAPITGARYQKLQWGPAPRALLPVRQELIEAGEVEFRGGDERDLNDVLIPIGEPTFDTLTAEDRTIADEVFAELRTYNAVATSDYSHLKSAGWNVVEMYEDIPYESVFVITDPPPPEAIELGRELAAKYGW
jgi:Antitoxin SocA-like, Panacea domain